MGGLGKKYALNEECDIPKDTTDRLCKRKRGHLRATFLMSHGLMENPWLPGAKGFCYLDQFCTCLYLKPLDCCRIHVRGTKPATKTRKCWELSICLWLPHIALAEEFTLLCIANMWMRVRVWNNSKILSLIAYRAVIAYGSTRGSSVG